jgi:hypothetical protein
MNDGTRVQKKDNPNLVGTVGFAQFNIVSVTWDVHPDVIRWYNISDVIMIPVTKQLS